MRGDWGTSRLRLFGIEGGRVTDRIEGAGIGVLKAAPSSVLSEALAPWMGRTAPASITLCGMAGSRMGLHETPYLDCPIDARSWAQAASPIDFHGVPLKITPGLGCVGAAGAADVMRGEEAQIFGACALQPDLEVGGVFVLPGTHSKWAWVAAGRITHFRTFMTGELFALLLSHSSLAAAGGGEEPEEAQLGFEAGLMRAQAGPGLAGALFAARAAQLREGRSADWAQGYISGLLIGGEIAEMETIGLLPTAIQIIGAPELSARYQDALVHFGVEARRLDADACVLRGLDMIDADD